MPSIAHIVTSQGLTTSKIASYKVKGCYHDPKGPGAWPSGTLYHCPICFVILIAGLPHPSKRFTEIVLAIQEIGLMAKIEFRKQFPKRPNLESWLRDDDSTP